MLTPDFIYIILHKSPLFKMFIDNGKTHMYNNGINTKNKF